MTGEIKAALSSLKAAISTVDQSDGTEHEKNIPRWNMELLQGNQTIRKMKLTKQQAERRLDLKENLEAIIPEKGGYAPGEPLERRIKK